MNPNAKPFTFNAAAPVWGAPVQELMQKSVSPPDPASQEDEEEPIDEEVDLIMYSLSLLNHLLCLGSSVEGLFEAVQW